MSPAGAESGGGVCALTSAADMTATAQTQRHIGRRPITRSYSQGTHAQDLGSSSGGKTRQERESALEIFGGDSTPSRRRGSINDTRSLSTQDRESGKSVGVVNRRQGVHQRPVRSRTFLERRSSNGLKTGLIEMALSLPRT